MEDYVGVNLMQYSEKRTKLHRQHELDMWQAHLDEKENKSWKQLVGKKEHA